MSKIKLSKDFIRNTVKRALNEDLYPSGDITSSLVKNNNTVKVNLLSNENAIIGGLLFAKQAFDLIDSKIKFLIKKKDGTKVKKGSLVLLHGRLPHYSCENTSNKSRHAYTLHVIDGNCKYSSNNWLQRSSMPLQGFI